MKRGPGPGNTGDLGYELDAKISDSGNSEWVSDSSKAIPVKQSCRKIKAMKKVSIFCFKCVQHKFVSFIVGNTIVLTGIIPIVVIITPMCSSE